MDPYEQQLLSVFATYDLENVGSLDRHGLTQLCQTLQLEEQTPELIESLLQHDHARATFPEFKEALLTLLGNMQQKDTHKSPEREVSPKYYGSKKYGRRTRPKIEEDLISSPVIQQQSQEHSQTVSFSKKRKTNYKKCTLHPENVQDIDELVCSEEMLREAWKKLGVGKDGFLNRNELIVVCDAIGLHKLADSVIRQLSSRFNNEDKISFQEVLEALQQDETWTDVLEPINNDSFADSKTFQFVTLGPDGRGFITAEALISMWESVGITAPKELLHELGFHERTINIVELATVLDKEIKDMHECRSPGADPHLILLQANLSLYQTEIKCLKHVFEQSHAEKEKLRNDVIEANNRAKLLAQEVDDNHARMERNAQNQVKLLEQRHSDILRDMSEQFAADKEQLTLVNQRLESKIAALECEIVKLKHDLDVAQQYSSTLDKENQSLASEIADLKHSKDALHGQIVRLEEEKRKYVEMEQEQLEPLLEKLSLVQVENAELRDKNDEMLAQIETINGELTALKAGQKGTGFSPCSFLDHSMDENEDMCVGLAGAKRRSDCSPSKDVDLFDSVDGNTRIGKVRKFYKDHLLELGPFASHESGFDTEIDISDSSSHENIEEITRLQAKIAFLEKVLQRHSIPIPDEQSLDDDDWSDLKTREHLLEKIFNDLHKVRQMFDKNGLTADTLAQIGDKLEKLMQNEPTSLETDSNAEKLRHFTEENAALKEKCAELENCIELLRTEYEKCEDYWQGKLDEERQIYEQDQQQNNDKLADLIAKMAEYEEQFVNQDNRLPPIEETDSLEQQFNDLEREYDSYREKTQRELSAKELEITSLKRGMTGKQQKDVSVQANTSPNLSVSLVENTNVLASDALPSQPDSLPWSQEAKSEDSWPASTSNSNGSTLEKNTTPCRPKRTRKHDRSSLYKRVHEGKKNEEVNASKEEQVIALPVRTVQGLNGRLYHLEQRCRQLQMALKQQHFFAEQAISQHVQSHRMEKTELQCLMRNLQEKLDHQSRTSNEQLDKLTRSDMLIKELYVENSYLIAKVQRLEQQCDFLAHRSSNNSL